MTSYTAMFALLGLGLVLPHVTATVPGYLGCYSDSRSRMLPYQKDFPTTLTPSICIEKCRSKAYAFAGLQFEVQCFCGNIVMQSLHSDDESHCDRTCPGDSSEFCGGFWYQNVYETGYLGCYRDSSSRMLEHQHDFPDTLTPAVCIEYCATNEYLYAGVQYGYQCFCGNNLIATQRADEDNCNRHCPGDSDASCGGFWHQNVFSSGYTGYMGCFDVWSSDGLLDHEEDFRINMTPDVCKDHCRVKGFTYAGIQNGYQCFCGDTLALTQKTGETHCNMACPGEPGRICGAVWYQNVYRTTT